jgi:hypothetical protein
MKQEAFIRARLKTLRTAAILFQFSSLSAAVRGQQWLLRIATGLIFLNAAARAASGALTDVGINSTS